MATSNKTQQEQEKLICTEIFETNRDRFWSGPVRDIFKYSPQFTMVESFPILFPGASLFLLLAAVLLSRLFWALAFIRVTLWRTI